MKIIFVNISAFPNATIAQEAFVKANFTKNQRNREVSICHRFASNRNWLP